jgi:hypothetical protein
MTRANGTLKESYKYGTYKELPDQYKNLLKTYIALTIFKNLEKMNLNEKGLNNFIGEAEKDRNILLKCNTGKTEERLKQGGSQIRTDSLNQKEGLKIPYESPQSSLLFSDNETKKLIAHEIAITHAYYDVWQKEGIQRPDTEAFSITCARADEVLHVDLKASSPEMHATFFENIRQVNESFKEMAKENPEQFRSALKDAIVKARTLNDWATNFTVRFDLKEDWVRDGMGQLGINQRNFDESYHKFLANPHITEETFIDQAVSDIVDNYQSDKIVQHYEEFMRANTSLKYIHNQLKAGIPAHGIPTCILGRKVVGVSGDMNDCLPRALLTGAHPKWPEPFLEMYVGAAKKHVIKKLKERGEAVYDTENRNVERRDQLNFGGDAGQILIEYLRSPSLLPWVEHPLLDPERPILTYQYKDGKIQCFEHTSGCSGKRPYAVLRNHHNQQSGHYWAIEDK